MILCRDGNFEPALEQLLVGLPLAGETGDHAEDVDHGRVRHAEFAIGYRVRSPRGTQFRQWATTHLREYVVKGFLMDDERLKNPGGWDYFDELLARIREIRASEKRFYQKVRDLFALSSDYKVREQDTNLFLPRFRTSFSTPLPATRPPN